jgi:hypothetical protein
VQPEFVEHAPEINEPADLRVTTAQSGDVGHARRISRAPRDARRKPVCRPEQGAAVPIAAVGLAFAKRGLHPKPKADPASSAPEGNLMQDYTP